MNLVKNFLSLEYLSMIRSLSGLLVFTLVSASGLTADTVVEEIIARVNNQIITRSDYLREQQQLKEEADTQDPAHSAQLAAESGKDVLRGLIDKQLLLEKGKDLGITAETEVIKRLDEMRKQMKLDTMEELEKAAESQGVSFEDFKQNLRTEIITQQVIQKEVGARINISKQEEQRFYDQHRAELARQEQVKLSEILISTENANNDETKIAEAKAKAEDLLKQIRAGAAFADVAKKYSQGPSAAEGGDLGYFERGKLAKQLEDMTFSMKKDQVSDVVHTKQGFVILMVTDHIAPGIPSLADIEPRLQEAVYMQKLQPALRDYLTQLREDAYIDVKPGYVDTGASPNQTKPIVTTAAKEANAKALKKRKKLGLF
ncbi:MAG: peptidylprolyl isomerase [Acidobacteria bacterium]|nr:peptidylprolyl isomerase [Acidobacteriota bacterium]